MLTKALIVKSEMIHTHTHTHKGRKLRLLGKQDTGSAITPCGYYNTYCTKEVSVVAENKPT